MGIYKYEGMLANIREALPITSQRFTVEDQTSPMLRYFNHQLSTIVWRMPFRCESRYLRM